jgi:hypothetical protein
MSTLHDDEIRTIGETGKLDPQADADGDDTDTTDGDATDTDETDADTDATDADADDTDAYGAAVRLTLLKRAVDGGVACTAVRTFALHAGYSVISAIPAEASHGPAPRPMKTLSSAAFPTPRIRLPANL